MSGIAGIYNLDGRPVDRALLDRMSNRLAHRGPDGSGSWVDGPVGLIHRRLHTTPQSLYESQPLRDETGTFCLTLDGRVDNREELRAVLEAHGAALRTDTDAELVLRAYQCWGADCTKRIIGDFALAIWDRQKRQLLCARDALGIKPFYYYSDDRTFIFASEMQPLFEGGVVQRKPNLPLIALYLSNCYDEPEETLYDGIYRLAAAHTLVPDGGHLRKAQYWDIDPSYTIRYGTDSEYAEHFLVLFQEAVQCRLRSTGPVATWLSGGLDSSSIACTAQVLYRDRIVPDTGFESFSIVFDELPCDERRYISEIVRKWGFKANTATYERDCLCTALDQVSEYPDVLYDPSLFMSASVLRTMRQRGFKVLLDGIGGDELLAAGFDHLTDLMQERRFHQLRQQLRDDAIVYSVPPWSLFLDYCLKPFIPKCVKTVLKPLLESFRRNGVPSLVNAEFLRSTGVGERLKAERVVQKFPTRSQQVIYNGLFFGWNPIMAGEMNELFTARFSVESRHPFLDRRLVEFLLAVPEEQRWRGDQPKIILRQAMRGILPETIRWRKGKAEFSCLINQELKHRQVEDVERLFRTSTLAAFGVIDTEQILQLFRRYCGNTRQYLTGIVGVVLGLELWCRSAMGHAPK